jgi:hypothetical protein
MSNHRQGVFAGVSALVLVGGCQLVSGLSGLRAEGTGGGGASSTSSGASSSGAGGATSSSSSAGSSSGGGGATSSSTSGSGGGGGGTTSSSTTSSSTSGGCTLGTSTDCAFCGNDCGSQIQCVGGECRSYELGSVTSGVQINAIAADGAHVFVAEGGAQTHIWRADFTPGGGFTVVVTLPPSTYVVDLVASPSADAIYWIEQPSSGSWSIHKAHPDGSSNTPLIALASGETPAHLALAGGQLYWGDTGKIKYAPAAGGAASMYSATGMTSDAPLAADVNHVFWASGGGPLNVFPLVSGMPTAAPGSLALALAIDPDPVGRVYWIDSTGFIYRTGKAAPGAPKLVDAVTDAQGALLVTSKHVYWSEPIASGCGGTVNLYRKPVADLITPNGGPQQQLTGCPRLAQDATAIFWNDNASIYRRVKP